ncbi:unnamed protein product [Absidia cylindrospora]
MSFQAPMVTGLETHLVKAAKHLLRHLGKHRNHRLIAMPLPPLDRTPLQQHHHHHRLMPSTLHHYHHYHLLLPSLLQCLHRRLLPLPPPPPLLDSLEHSDGMDTFGNTGTLRIPFGTGYANTIKPQENEQSTNVMAVGTSQGFDMAFGLPSPGPSTVDQAPQQQSNSRNPFSKTGTIQASHTPTSSFNHPPI